MLTINKRNFFFFFLKFQSILHLICKKKKNLNINNKNMNFRKKKTC